MQSFIVGGHNVYTIRDQCCYSIRYQICVSLCGPLTLCSVKSLANQDLRNTHEHEHSDDNFDFTKSYSMIKDRGWIWRELSIYDDIYKLYYFSYLYLISRAATTKFNLSLSILNINWDSKASSWRLPFTWEAKRAVHWKALKIVSQIDQWWCRRLFSIGSIFYWLELGPLLRICFSN